MNLGCSSSNSYRLKVAPTPVIVPFIQLGWLQPTVINHQSTIGSFHSTNVPAQKRKRPWVVATQTCFGIFTPRIVGNDPIWRSYFSDGLVQAPTRALLFRISEIEAVNWVVYPIDPSWRLPPKNWEPRRVALGFFRGGDLWGVRFHLPIFFVGGFFIGWFPEFEKDLDGTYVFIEG